MSAAWLGILAVTGACLLIAALFRLLPARRCKKCVTMDIDDDWQYTDDDDDPRCTICNGEIWVECDDPIQCTYLDCDGELHRDPACGGTGLAEHQVIW